MINKLFFVSGLAVLMVACSVAIPETIQSPDLTLSGRDVRRLALGPVAFAVRQPDESCSLYIDETLRSALSRELRYRGYDVFTLGESVPRTFATGSPPPRLGSVPDQARQLLKDADAVVLVWLDEYWDNTLCEWSGPKSLTMGAVAILYAGSPPVEIWRGKARDAEQGGYSAEEIMWLTTTRLAESVLKNFPAAR